MLELSQALIMHLPLTDESNIQWCRRVVCPCSNSLVSSQDSPPLVVNSLCCSVLSRLFWWMMLWCWTTGKGKEAVLFSLLGSLHKRFSENGWNIFMMITEHLSYILPHFPSLGAFTEKIKKRSRIYSSSVAEYMLFMHKSQNQSKMPGTGRKVGKKAFKNCSSLGYSWPSRKRRSWKDR